MKYYINVVLYQPQWIKPTIFKLLENDKEWLIDVSEVSLHEKNISIDFKENRENFT